MKIIHFKTIVLSLLLVPSLIWGNDRWGNGKHTKEKTIKKEFMVNPTALLKVTNDYGNLTLTSWTEDRIVMEIHIMTNGNNEERVQEKLEEISVDFEANSDRVSARTIFKDRSSGWGWNWGRNNTVNMQINYIIKLPVKNSVHLDNDYGNILLDRIDGHAKISCDYGRLEIGELRGRNNQLNFDYTSKSTFEYINSAEIRADYSSFQIENAGDLRLLTDYTDADIERMGNLSYTSDYGKISVGEGNDIVGTGDYITVRLGTIKGNVDITADYGSLRIERMTPEAGDIDIKTDYTGIKIGYDTDYHFTFNIRTSYAGVSGRDNFETKISIEKSSDRQYEGYYGSENSKNEVTINSDYGGITFIEK